MSASEHDDHLLAAFLQALNKVSDMSGSLKAIEVSLKEDIKPELRAIKQELKEKVNMTEHMEQKAAIIALSARVLLLESNASQKEAVRKSWYSFVFAFLKNWKDVSTLLLVIYLMVEHMLSHHMLGIG